MIIESILTTMTRGVVNYAPMGVEWGRRRS
jgi:hypothetical protein